MFLFAIDGAMVQLLSANSVDERDKLLDYFLQNGVSRGLKKLKF
jgi:hypothetical protein